MITVSKICHEHCPDDSTGPGAVVLVLVLAATVTGLAAVIEDIIVAALVVLAVVGVASVAVLALVLRRNRHMLWHPARIPATRRVPAISAPRHRPGELGMGRARALAIEPPRPASPPGPDRLAREMLAASGHAWHRQDRA